LGISSFARFALLIPAEAPRRARRKRGSEKRVEGREEEVAEYGKKEKIHIYNQYTTIITAIMQQDWNIPRKK
jgi:hypothetical protein